MTIINQVALGVYIGILTGMFTALLIFGVGFVFQYVAGTPFPATLGLMIGLGAAGLQGGMFRLMRDPAMLQSPVILSALMVVLLITNYSQKRAQDLAKAAPPKSAVISRIRTKTLSPDVIKQLGRFGQVRITVSGDVMDMEGYPPLPDDIRSQIRNGKWKFPGDLPIPELEKRLAEQLKTEYNLDDITVTIDDDGTAAISAAPASSGLSRRIPEAKRAISLETLVPTGLAFGDEVEFQLEGETVPGSVVSVKPPESKKTTESDVAKPVQGGQTAAGGEGRVTVAVDRSQVERSLSLSPSDFIVKPRGRNREYELISLLRQGDNSFQKITVRTDGPLDGQTIKDLNLRSEYDVDILAIKRHETWVFGPVGSTTLSAGEDLFIAGPTTGINRLQEQPAA